MRPKARVMLAMEQLDEVSYFELLQVAPGASLEKLRKRFRSFAWAFHPDRFPDDIPAVRATAKKVFERGVEAYTVLRNPTAAALYMERFQAGILRLSAEDFQSLSRVRSASGQQTSTPQSSAAPSSVNRPLALLMKTPAGKAAAERVDWLIQAKRYREAYTEAGYLETLEPENAAVRERTSKLAAYLK